MNLTPNFTLEEMTVTQEGTRRGIANIPDVREINYLRELCRNVLEPLREALGKPIVVSSGFRSQTINSMVGGAKTSDHLYGRAADIIVPGYTPLAVAKKIVAMNLPFKQVIEEFGSWVHVSIPEFGVEPKREQLTAIRHNGRVIYEKGLA